MTYKKITRLLFVLAISITATLVACGPEGETPLSSTDDFSSNSRVVPGQVTPIPIFQSWPTIVDYQALVDSTSNQLFQRTGMALTLDGPIGGAGSINSGDALFQETFPNVTVKPYTVAVSRVQDVYADVYIDPNTGNSYDVVITTFAGTINSGIASVSIDLSAVTITDYQASTGHYLLVAEPSGPAIAKLPGFTSAEPYLLGDRATGKVQADQEDPCDGCITTHNKARNKALKRHKSCRRKALLYGGGATLLASFGGPWGTAGGLLATAAAVDACNTTLQQAKEDAIDAYCQCWANNDCDPSNSDYEENCG